MVVNEKAEENIKRNKEAEWNRACEIGGNGK